MQPTIRLVPGHVLLPSRRAKAFIVVEAGQRWRIRDKRRNGIEISVIDKVDGRAYYRDHAGVVRYLACEDLRRRFELVAMDA